MLSERGKQIDTKGDTYGYCTLCKTGYQSKATCDALNMYYTRFFAFGKDLVCEDCIKKTEVYLEVKEENARLQAVLSYVWDTIFKPWMTPLAEAINQFSTTLVKAYEQLQQMRTEVKDEKDSLVMDPADFPPGLRSDGERGGSDSGTE